MSIDYASQDTFGILTENRERYSAAVRERFPTHEDLLAEVERAMEEHLGPSPEARSALRDIAPLEWIYDNGKPIGDFVRSAAGEYGQMSLDALAATARARVAPPVTVSPALTPTGYISGVALSAPANQNVNLPTVRALDGFSKSLGGFFTFLGFSDALIEGLDNPGSADALKAYVTATTGALTTIVATAGYAAIFHGFATSAAVALGVSAAPFLVGAAIAAPVVGIGIGMIYAAATDRTWDYVAANAESLIAGGMSAAAAAAEALKGACAFFDSPLAQTGQAAVDFAREALANAPAFFDDFANAVESAARWMVDAFTAFAAATVNASPLVLDRDGDGVELVALEDSVVLWDLTGDGVAERTGWVAPDDAFLAIDRDGDGTIGSADELFGTAETDGFQILAPYDSDGDGWIDADDAAFANLLLWRDLDQDGLAEEGEMQSLAAAGIVRIEVDPSRVDRENAGHTISHVAAYEVETADGVERRAIEDVWFRYDPLFTVDRTPYTVDPDVLWLPELRGYGTVGSLHRRIMEDEADDGSLRDAVEALAARGLAEVVLDAAGTREAVRQIVFEWTGVEDVDPASRGPYVDARMLAALEALFGQSYLQRGSYPDPFYLAGQDLFRAFDAVEKGIGGQLLGQTGLAALFAGPVFYAPAAGAVVGDRTLDPTVLEEVSDLVAGAADKPASWALVLSVIDEAVGLDALAAADRARLEAAIVASDPALDLAAVAALLSWQSEEGERIGGTSGDDELGGGSGNDTIRGGYGDDTIEGGIGADRRGRGGRGRPDRRLRRRPRARRARRRRLSLRPRDGRRHLHRTGRRRGQDRPRSQHPARARGAAPRGGGGPGHRHRHGGGDGRDHRREPVPQRLRGGPHRDPGLRRRDRDRPRRLLLRLPRDGPERLDPGHR